MINSIKWQSCDLLRCKITSTLLSTKKIKGDTKRQIIPTVFCLFVFVYVTFVTYGSTQNTDRRHLFGLSDSRKRGQGWSRDGPKGPRTSVRYSCHSLSRTGTSNMSRTFLSDQDSRSRDSTDMGFLRSPGNPSTCPCGLTGRNWRSGTSPLTFGVSVIYRFPVSQ